MLQYRASDIVIPYISIATSNLLFKQRRMLQYPALPLLLYNSKPTLKLHCYNQRHLLQ